MIHMKLRERFCYRAAFASGSSPAACHYDASDAHIRAQTVDVDAITRGAGDGVMMLYTMFDCSAPRALMLPSQKDPVRPPFSPARTPPP